MPDSSLGVIIVSYNTCQFLRGCLLALRRVVDEGPFDIVVADNGSTDGSVDMVRNEFPEIRLLALSQNLGFARANNRATQELRCPEILFLNPDTVVTRGAVARLRQTLASHPSAAVIGGQLVNESGDPLASSFAFPSLWREFWSLLPELKGLFRVRALASRLSRLMPQLWRGSYRADPEARQVDSVGGACMIVRGDAFREMGGFCEEFFLYHEEMELCYRLRQQGQEVWLEPRARILHYEGRSSGARHSRLAPIPVLGYRLRGMKYFWSHHHPGVRYRVWQVMVRGLLTLRAALCVGGGVLAGHKVRARLLTRAGDLRALARELKASRA